MKSSRVPFIVIEALDAGGSQTQTNLLVERLKREKRKPHQYHFPQEDAATGRLIYDKFLLYKNKHPFSKREQALLYTQDFYSRADEMHALQKNDDRKTVLVSDRYCTSTMAYQTIGLSGGQRRDMLKWLEWLCWGGTPKLLKPSLVLFLDTPVEVSLKHLASKKKDYFESRAKLTAIRRSYMRLASEKQWTVLSSMEGDTQRSKHDIHEEVWKHVVRLLSS